MGVKGGGSFFRSWDCESTQQKGEKLIRCNPLARTPKYPYLRSLLLLRRARGCQAYLLPLPPSPSKKIGLFINPH